MKMEHIVIVDFGSQYTQLIARRIREAGVYSVIVPPSKAIQSVTSRTKGIVLSGGPASVYDSNAPDISPDIFKKDIPVLGICYGMQIMAYKMDGSVEKSSKREYGRATLEMRTDNPLFDSIPDNSIVWMSHSDRVTQVPSGFEIIGRSENTEAGAVYNSEKNIYGLQFHPEVVHTFHGRQMLSNFVHRICDCRAAWSPESFVRRKIDEIKERYPEGNIISGISGGVDSTVATEMVHRAAGDRLKCFMIDTGLLRYREGEKTVELLREKTGLDIELIDASDRFIDALEGVTDPEKKRKIIGQLFIEEFEKEAEKFENARYLVQGTIYPDRIESDSTGGPSTTIKSHHNVGGLPERMNLGLIEPLKELFKDEVRQAGRELGIAEDILMKHPFPGPGLAVRIVGEITRKRIDILQKADRIYIDTIKKYNLYDAIWQAFAVFLPVKSVGVMGDNRTYDNVIALRAVTSLDGMTADWFEFPGEVLSEVSTRIINEIEGVNRVVYDISTKPPSTIEWE